MADRVYHVRAVWDAEAKVWCADSDDVPGLVAEAATIEELIEEVRELVPELLRLNGVNPDADSAPVSIVAEYQGHVRLRA